MKSVNIFTLAEISNNFSANEFHDFLEVYGIELKHKEIDDLISLVQNLDSTSSEKRIFESFYVGYKIPQIGKEFDLIRIGKKAIVNIELKCVYDEEKIKKQLVRNKYYMSHINKELFFFTYVSSDCKLFSLSHDDELLEVECSELAQALYRQGAVNTKNPSRYFDPIRYLVSPFNSTEKFINGEYFLTNQQEEIKNKILKDFNSLSGRLFTTISGNAGTGKTLLVYDIAKTIAASKKTIIVHCANLNEGQGLLIQNGWNIVSVKDFFKTPKRFIDDNDYIVIDEAQRMSKEQLASVGKLVKEGKKYCLFSYDQRQTLSKKEELTNVEQHFKNISPESKFKLTEKIRSNESIANLIMSLFDLRYPKRTIRDRDNLELIYFSSQSKASDYIASIIDSDWKVLGLTPSLYSKDSHEFDYSKRLNVSHEVIGQEFDNVVVVIDDKFDYEKNLLVYRGKSYYGAVNMLFQNMTRTRKKLLLLVVNNKRVFSEALGLIKGT